MNGVLWYLAGAVTVPVGALAVRTVRGGLEVGHRSSCEYCGYDTGPISTTRKITAGARWLWHEQVGRRTGTCAPAGERRGSASKP